MASITRNAAPRRYTFQVVRLLIALLLSAPLFLSCADGPPQPDRWRGLILDSTSPAEAASTLGSVTSDKLDRLFLGPLRKWFTPGLNGKTLRKQSFKAVDGFEQVDLYYRNEKLVVIQLMVAKPVAPTALKNIYGLEFEPCIDGIMEGFRPQDFERHAGRTYPKTFPSAYSLVAVSEHSIVSAGVSNSSLGSVMLQSMGARDTAGGGFPGKVKSVQLISRTLENRSGEDLLK